ncbi:hypothetical protein Tco_0251243 [Tanacetum coccineum]
MMVFLIRCSSNTPLVKFLPRRAEAKDDDETIEWVDTNKEEEKKDDDDEKSIDLEQTDDEETNDEFMHVNDDEDEEITHAKVEESGNGDAEITDAVKVDAGKTKEAKDDAKKVELPPTSSSLSISSGFGAQFLKLSSYTSLVSMVKDTTNIEINSLLDIQIQSEVPHIQSPPVLTVPVLVISEPLVLTPIPETPSVALATTLLPPPSISTIPHILLQTTTPMPAPPIITEAPTITTIVPESDALTDVQLRVTKLKKDVYELKKSDHSAEALVTLKSQVPMVVEHYLGSKIAPDPSKILTSTIDLEPESKKSASEIHKIKKEQAEKQNMPKYTIKSTNKAALKEYCKILEIITQWKIDGLAKSRERKWERKLSRERKWDLYNKITNHLFQGMEEAYIGAHKTSLKALSYESFETYIGAFMRSLDVSVEYEHAVMK